MKKNLKRLVYTFVAAVVLIAGSCEKSAIKKEQEAIDTWLEENSITVEPTYSGLYYIETEAGTGDQAKGGLDAKVKYKGTFLDGEEFDSGTFTFTIGIGRVIRGWDEGIAYMKEGGKAILLIPSDLGYGSAGSGPIPGYTPLLFEVELLEVD